MERKEFLRKGILGTGLLAAAVSGLKAIAGSFEIQPGPKPQPDIIGFNHIQNTKSKLMENTIFHPADTRGLADHGWLKSRHTFSFANYYNPDRMHFGVLRVLNDDIVAGGQGFGTHPHDNMEIISIPLSGDLEHQDSMGNKAVIRHGDIQVMSAGTGIRHSEYNAHKDKEVRFLQIWLFPNRQNVVPRYDQISLKPGDRKNKLQQVLSPNPEDAGVWIHQNAWFHLADFDSGMNSSYALQAKGNGVYIFNLDGHIRVNGQSLHTRDGFGIWDVDQVEIEAVDPSQFLVMEVPMELK